MGYGSDDDLISDDDGIADPLTPSQHRRSAALRQPSASPTSVPFHDFPLESSAVLAAKVRQLRAAQTGESVANVPDYDSGDEEHGTEAAKHATAASEVVAAVLTSATAGTTRGAASGRRLRDQAHPQLRRRHRPPALAGPRDDAYNVQSAVSHGGLDFGFVTAKRGTRRNTEANDEWTAFKGA